MNLNTADEDAEIDWLARSFSRARRARHAFFRESDLFGEPMWDMLLELFIAARTGREVSVTSACIATRLPYREALVALDRMMEHALVRRDTDRSDPGRDVVTLTDRGRTLMTEYLESLLPNYYRNPA